VTTGIGNSGVFNPGAGNSGLLNPGAGNSGLLNAGILDIGYVPRLLGQPNAIYGVLTDLVPGL
jgi:hypothetical protein